MKTENIVYGDVILAIIMYKETVPPGVRFFTSDDNPLQVGKQLRPKGVIIAPHMHCPVMTDCRQGFLQEVLYIEKGKLKVNFYDANGNLIVFKILQAGDTILLISGGHGFEVLEEVQMLEVKMGPYDPASKKNLEVRQS